MNGQIIYVSNTYAGSVHDLTILSEFMLPDLLSVQCKAIADKGFISPQYRPVIITPPKKPRGGPLTDQQKEDTKTISARRAIIENLHALIKQWAIIKQTWRSTYSYMPAFDRILHVVCALANIHLIKHPLRQQ